MKKRRFVAYIAIICVLCTFLSLFSVSASAASVLKPSASGISASFPTSVKNNASLTVSVTLSASCVADSITVQVGKVQKTVSGKAIAVLTKPIRQNAKIVFSGWTFEPSTYSVTVLVKNSVGSVSKKVGNIKVISGFSNPLKAISGGKTNIITQSFSANAYDSKRDHLGTDYSGAASYVTAIINGTVIDIYTGNGYGYGNAVIIRSTIYGKTVYIIYGHMKDNSLKIKKGDCVVSGQVLGTMWSSGNSTGKHVHVGVFTGAYKTGGKTVPAGYYSKTFSNSAYKVSYGTFTYFDPQRLITSAGTILKG